MNSRFHYAALERESHGDLFDITSRKHGGNEESRAAFETISDRLTEKQEFVLKMIREAGDHGMTCDELSEKLGRGENVYSGRFTELKIAGKIEQIGKRPTRSGCPAAVWRAV